jgi:hypothetical protein
MAQETAGTIGIPVLKNELLPYLTDYARRRERAELYKQKAEQRAAELAAKRAAEMEKYVPPALETAKGGYWNPWINKQMKVEVEAAKEKIKAARNPSEAGAAAEEFNRRYNAYNYSGDQETQRQKQNIESLRQSGYNVDENALAQYYGEQAEANPNFAGTNHIVNFKEWVKSKPERYISPAAIGTNLLKQYQPVSVGIKTREGKDESFTYNPLFEPERVKDQLTGANIFRAEKPNLVKIQEALEANPNLREAADAYIDPIAARVKKDNPGMSSTEAYTLAAGEFFGKALPQGRAKETYDYSEVRPKAIAPKKKPEETTQIVETPITATVYQKVVDKKVGEPFQRVVEVNFGMGENVTLPKNRRVQVGANRKVFVLGGDAETAVKEKILRPSGLGDGSYVLNYGFDVQTYQKPKSVYRLTKDYEFTQKGGGKIKYKAGTILDTNKVNLLKQAGATDAYKAIPRPIRISPRMMQWSEEAEQYRTPVMSNLDLVISESEIPDLQQIEKEGQKQKSGGVLSSW